tara:strand:- start:1483 stop:2010 length:528 start_codon:yes stop_codon:yes gene_type:complete
MKTITKIILSLSILLLSSCNIVRVNSDYNNKIDFNSYKTYAFSKKGIDEVEINDIDKKRILNAIDVELSNKGLRKSIIEPDILINFFTESNKKINYYPGYDHYSSGLSIGPWYNSYYYHNYTEGVLFIDIIDYKKNELIWQGVGKGYIPSKRDEKEDKIKLFVNKILMQYPPVKN